MNCFVTAFSNAHIPVGFLGRSTSIVLAQTGEISTSS